MRLRIAQSPGHACLGVLREPGSLSSCMGHTVEPGRDWAVSGWDARPLSQGHGSIVESSVFSPCAHILFCLVSTPLTKTTSWHKVVTSLSLWDGTLPPLVLGPTESVFLGLPLLSTVNP